MLQKSYVFLRRSNLKNMFVLFGNYGFTTLVSLIFGGKCRRVEYAPAWCAENEKSAEKMNSALLLKIVWHSLFFPSIGGCGAAKFKPLRYGAIEGKNKWCKFSAWHWYEKLLFWKQGKWCVPRGLRTSLLVSLKKDKYLALFALAIRETGQLAGR